MKEQKNEALLLKLSEEIAARETERETLLAISNHLAAVRNPNTLMKVIAKELKPQLGFTHIAISLVNDDGKTASTFLVDQSSTSRNHPSWKQVITAKFPINDGVMSKVFETPFPVSFDLDEFIKHPDVPIYLRMLNESGTKQLIWVRLSREDRAFGMWMLMFDKKDIMNPSKLSLITGIANQLSIAVSNILANEEIENREKEKSILLSLSNDIASIASRSDFSKFVSNRLKQILGITEFGIAQIDEGGKTYSAFMLEFTEESRSVPGYDPATSSRYSVEDPIFKAIIEAKDSAVFDVDKVSKEAGMPAYVQFWQKAGFKHYRAVPLRVGNNTIGFMTFHIEDKTAINTKSLLFKSVCAQIAVAVSNILSSEEIAARVRERELLLSVSNDLAAVRNPASLMEVIGQKLRPQLGFTHIAIGVVNEDGKTYSTLLVDRSSKSRHHPLWNQSITAQHPINDGIMNQVLSSDTPIVFNLNEEIKRKEVPVFITMLYDSGTRQFVGIRLINEDHAYGMWVLLLDTNDIISKSNLSLIEGLANQISIAVLNIRANEEIAIREEEKTILLSLSNEIALLVNRTDFFKVVNDRLKQIFPITEFGIAQIDEDGKTFSAFMLEFSEKSKSVPDYEQTISSKYSIEDPIFKAVMNAKDPIVLDIEIIAKQPGMPSYVEFWKQAGFKHYVLVPLRVGSSNIGFIHFHLENKAALNTKSMLLKGVCAQLAVAVSNILAHEEIVAREIEREVLLSINNDFAAVRDHERLMEVIGEKLKPQLGFTHMSIASFGDDGKTFCNLFRDPTSKSRLHPFYQQVISNTFDTNDGVMNRVYSTADPIVLDLDEEIKKQHVPVYFKMLFESGTKLAIIIRLSKINNVFGFWIMLFDQKNLLSQSKLSLVTGLSYQLSTAVSNILANEEIASREKEKTILLSLSKEISTLVNKSDFSRVVNSSLKQLFSVDQFLIAQVDESGKTYSSFVLEFSEETKKVPGFDQAVLGKYSVQDPIFLAITSSENPVIFDFEEIANLPGIPAHVDFWIRAGIRYSLSTPLRVGNRVIGLINFNLTDKKAINTDSILLRGVCAQIAVAMSNILANEKVNRQFNEINAYKSQLEEEKIYLKQEIETNHNYAEIIGNGPEMRKVFRLVTQVAKSESTVLILGETGTGKELIARAIHNDSPRKDRLMVKVNCATLPANLIESELFGHERGSFTGAHDRRIGKFELANKGSLFLDEVGELPLELQAKLLRVLQEKEVERIGGKNTITVDVRIIAATNRDLEKEMAEGRFRSDLYYRLNIFPISLPPLRSRREDIPLLATHFIQKLSKKTGKRINKISSNILQELLNYNWPGNIRELEHLIERSILLTEGDTIRQVQLPILKPNGLNTIPTDNFSLMTIDEQEREHIINMLKYCGGRVAGEGGAAERLGVPTSTLHSKMKRLGIKRKFLIK